MATEETKVAISGPDFIRWMELMDLTIDGAMAQLGIGSRHTIIKYRRDGAPLYIALAIAAIDRGLEPWKPR